MSCFRRGPRSNRVAVNGKGVAPGLFGLPTGSTTGMVSSAWVALFHTRVALLTVSGALKVWSARE
ncbi:hypothetical protein D3C85_1279460 [compost metagenome]